MTVAKKKQTKRKTTRKKAVRKKAVRKAEPEPQEEPQSARFLEVAPGEHLLYPQQIVPTQPGARYRGGEGTVVDAGQPYEEVLLAGQHRKLVPSRKRKATPFNSPSVQRWVDQYMQKLTGSVPPSREEKLQAEANANPNGEDDIAVDAEELEGEAGIEMTPEDDFGDLNR
jgi:hypothetical protein